MRDANLTVEWTPEYMGKRMDDWLVNMSDWNISRRRYYGLPLPFYPCGCGHLTVVSSKAQLAELATDTVEPSTSFGLSVNLTGFSAGGEAVAPGACRD